MLGEAMLSHIVVDWDSLVMAGIDRDCRKGAIAIHKRHNESAIVCDNAVDVTLLQEDSDGTAHFLP